MADDASQPRYDVSGTGGAEKVKIICLGDSAVGKSKWANYVSLVPYCNAEVKIKFILI